MNFAIMIGYDEIFTYWTIFVRTTFHGSATPLITKRAMSVCQQRVVTGTKRRTMYENLGEKIIRFTKFDPYESYDVIVTFFPSTYQMQGISLNK